MSWSLGVTVVTSDDNPVGTLQQQLATSLSFGDQHPQTPPLSRTAHLHLTNRLARFIPISLTIIALTSLHIGIIALPVLTLNIVVWFAMLTLGLVHSARETFAYRAGDQITSSRPLRWRANHTACMAVTGTIIASGIILLPEITLPLGVSLPVYLCAATFFAALCQHWHRLAAFSLFAPVAMVSVASPVIANGALIMGGASLVVALAFTLILWLSTQRALHRAAAQYPRTKTFLQTDFIAPLRRIPLRRNISEIPRKSA